MKLKNIIYGMMCVAALGSWSMQTGSQATVTLRQAR